MIGFGDEGTDKFVGSVLLVCIIFIFFWGIYDVSNNIGLVDWVKERACNQPTPIFEAPSIYKLVKNIQALLAK